MRIDRIEAQPYFAHPSQRKYGLEDELPGSPFEYFAESAVCGAFHPTFWPGIWMAHVGVKPEAWGKSIKPALTILEEFTTEFRPERIIAWIDEENRAALKFAQRLGFVEDGYLPTGVFMLGRK